jgi:hypothetical protein
VDAAAVLLALRVVDRDNLHAVGDEPLGGRVAVVDGEQHLAGPKREAVDDARVVRVMDLDGPDLQIPERLAGVPTGSGVLPG